ncbi:hypothetical protein ACLVNC_12155, partial [Streptococcus pneumoniae]
AAKTVAAENRLLAVNNKAASIVKNLLIDFMISPYLSLKINCEQCNELHMTIIILFLCKFSKTSPLSMVVYLAKKTGFTK